MSFYSANQVDQIISPHLPEFGYAVDVGANNGLVASNSKHFEDKGWYVLCVEPNPNLAEEGRKNRKLWVESAVGSVDVEEKKCEFEMVGAYPWASFSGLHPKEAPDELTPGQWKNEIANSTRILTRMVTLNTLLRHCGFPRLDLLTVDVEGHELFVLEGIDLNLWTPKIIVAESWSEQHRAQITEYLSRFNYVLDKVCEYDGLYGKR